VAVETHSIVTAESKHAIRFPEPGAQLASGALVACFPAAPESPGRARRLLADALRACDCEPGLVDAAALVLSELASNAVRHVGSPFSIRATLEGATLRLAVEDHGWLSRAAMVVRQAHGLGVVDALAADWGVKPTARGKLVWVELPLGAVN